MTDIIAHAQKLAANGHTPGPWHYRSNEGYHEVGSIDGLMFDADSEEDGLVVAFAPDAVAALAEETWVYGVEIFIGGRWIMVKNKALATSTIEAAAWFPDRRSAEALQGVVEIPSETRIVRRRVSPVEVVE